METSAIASELSMSDQRLTCELSVVLKWPACAQYTLLQAAHRVGSGIHTSSTDPIETAHVEYHCSAVVQSKLPKSKLRSGNRKQFPSLHWLSPSLTSFLRALCHVLSGLLPFLENTTAQRTLGFDGHSLNYQPSSSSFLATRRWCQSSVWRRWLQGNISCSLGSLTNQCLVAEMMLFQLHSRDNGSVFSGMKLIYSLQICLLKTEVLNCGSHGAGELLRLPSESLLLMSDHTNVMFVCKWKKYISNEAQNINPCANYFCSYW